MSKKIAVWITMTLALAWMAGCDGGIMVGGKSVGVRSGELVSSAGYVLSTYTKPLDRVWKAVGDVMNDMKATDATWDKKIAQGTFTGMVYGDKVVIKVNYLERDRTQVSILVGMGGSQIAARLLHDKIFEKLGK